ncbi:MAG: adenylate/guanylate cyclase domain-containing protein [Proteobacteria bacterium]|nr:adenylate/guanylate cyclase domain-containing protein [Pseudomonadota bacterium]
MIPAAEARTLQRRYMLTATSIFVLDLGITVLFMVVSGAWSNAWRTVGMGLVFLLVVNWTVARRLFRPIADHLAGRLPYAAIQRRLTQLPLLTAQAVAVLTFVVWAFRLSMPWWLYVPDSTPMLLLAPTVADFCVTLAVLTIFYFTFTYFVVSDYLATLCTTIFERTGENLGLFFGSYRSKLMVALIVISIGPLAAILTDLYSYDDTRVRSEILVDIASAVLGVAITAYFITRSLLRPMTVLSAAMKQVAEGRLDVRAPVTSNDEIGAVTGQFNTMVEGLRERERIRETFGRYVDESVAAAILQAPDAGAGNGEIREATILFTDIAGFTTIAEYLEPRALVAALNEYLETVLAPIKAHGGVVNTFIGDGLFASFNMPLPCEDHACAAVRAAIDIQRAVGSRTFGAEGVALATRIGISTGPVIGGSIGAGQRMSFTLLGDTVNLAARLEELNKHHGTRILVSESTRAICGDRFAFASLGSVPVRGRSDTIAIHSIDPRTQET